MDPSYALFLKIWCFKDIKYDILEAPDQQNQQNQQNQQISKKSSVLHTSPMSFLQSKGIIFEYSTLHRSIITANFSCQITSHGVSTLRRIPLTKMSTFCYTQPDGKRHPPRRLRQMTIGQDRIFLQTSNTRKTIAPTKLKMISKRL